MQCFSLYALLVIACSFTATFIGFFLAIPGILAGIVDIGFAIKEYKSK